MSAESKLSSYKSQLKIFEEALLRSWVADETVYHERAIEKLSSKVDGITNAISNLYTSIAAAERDIQREAEARMRAKKK